MKTPAITLPKEQLMRFGEVIAQEWLLTNGVGGYASSSVLGINTRKYHGLLVAALNPPGERTVCFEKLDEDLLVGDSTYRLGANEFGDTIFPEGYKQIEEFRLDPYPAYTYSAGNVALKKTVFLLQRKNAVAVLYQAINHNAFDAKIRLYPLLNCRYYHNVTDNTRAPLYFTQQNSNQTTQVTFQHPQATTLCRVTEGRFVEGLNWVKRLHYRDESSRGEASFDDCFQPGYFEVDLPANAPKVFSVTCATGRSAPQVKEEMNSLGATTQEIQKAFGVELDHKEALLTEFYQAHPVVPQSDWLNWTLLAADSFIVQNVQGRKDIIAGYHWFEPWGRDTFISLPGLLLVTGRYSEAKEILRSFIGYLKGGLIPNFIADKTGDLAYNTVDGTLWYINAVLQYVKYTGDFDFVKSELWSSLRSIIEHHERGTMFGIRLDEDGLLLHGPQLTWMDASVDGVEITPRAGKAVEIEALWYNALRTMQMLAEKFGDDNLKQEYAEIAEHARRSFNTKFWNPLRNCLFDVLEPKAIDASMRPNQIFAVSLDYSMLNMESSLKVVEVVERELVATYGLRTLSLNDPKFVGKCYGDRRSRDAAYHNGTIWPWLLGPYVTAYLKAHDYAPEVRKETLEKLLLPFFTDSIKQGGLGTINEIYDCHLPNEPRGCISQAWSVAEPLRAYVEDVLQVKPKIRV
ncbi:MAG TPA: amylo-alpha-1,6-glucosidase [Candidatus Acidoferrales bacterium]|nr:amylo-alpha-1,6-glucosidase [Candidatus Acidoferrales bacterium]